MQEAFLHYLWQFQQFDKSDLQTISGEKISILKTGIPNSDAGPDFSNARIMIDNIEWAGNVEIHIRSSDWNLHQHTDNQGYNNVILHVVWENNQMISRPDGSEIPTISLEKITDKKLIEKYQYLVENRNIIPCSAEFSKVSELSKIAILDKALTKRLIQKSKIVENLLEKNNGDWEETAYQLLAKNFGFKLNSDVFLRLAQNLPLKILQKHRNNLFQIEAMLFGLAFDFTNEEKKRNFGLEENIEEGKKDEYFVKLKQEFDFLSTKYDLKEKALQPHQWKFLRTRPANFPTIRIAQLARLIASQQSFFSLFTQTESFSDLQKSLKIEQSEYWQTHHHFGKESNRKLNGIGRDSIENIIINTVIPLLACYAQMTDNQNLMERAIAFLENLPAEKNNITEVWEGLGLSIKNAFDSQASIELYNHFCLERKCLLCNIGIEILKK